MQPSFADRPALHKPSTYSKQCCILQKKKKKNLAKNTMSYRIKEEDFLLLERKGNRMFCEFGFQLRQGIKQ